jgi:hypothetical protein
MIRYHPLIEEEWILGFRVWVFLTLWQALTIPHGLSLPPELGRMDLVSPTD